MKNVKIRCLNTQDQYAVVLEENELVRKDIYQYKNVNINVIEYIRKTYDINMDWFIKYYK